jgi:hypothetical protein
MMNRVPLSITNADFTPEGDANIYLAQTEGDFIGPSTGFNYTEAQREIERLAREAELGLYEAQAACDDPEAARHGADKAEAAADAAENLFLEGHDATWPNWDRLQPNPDLQKPGSSEPDSQEALDEFAEMLDDRDAAENYARRADAIADAVERGEECPEPLLTSSLELPTTTARTGSLETPLSSTPPSDASAGASADMRDPAHGDHPRYARAYAEIASIDGWPGHSDATKSERFAAVTAFQTKADGLETIGRVSMTSQNTQAFVSDTEDPSVSWAKYSKIDVIAAVATPVEVSNRNLNQLNASLPVLEQGTERVETRENYQSGPVLNKGLVV